MVRRFGLIVVFVLMVAGVVAVAPAGVSAAPCTVTDFNGLTAALIDPPTVTGNVDATGCDIGVYYNTGTGTINNANIHDALWYGVVVNGDNNVVKVDVTNSSIHDIGDKPFNGVQRGVAVYYRSFDGAGSASGTVTNNNVYRYQKGGIVGNGNVAVTVTGNTVTGLGSVDFIAQNGIQVAYGGTALVQDNAVSGNDYTPKSYVACGILYFNANGVRASENKFSNNERNLCNFGKDDGQYHPFA